MSVLIDELMVDEVVVNGEKLQIKKLSIIQTLKLFKAVTKMFIKNAERFKSMKEGKNNLQDIFEVLDAVNEDELFEILSILLNKPKDFCSQVGLKEFGDIITLIYEKNKNDIEGIVKNLKRAMAKKEVVKA